MVTTAIIIASDEAGVSVPTHFGGLSLLKRAVFTAQKAGVTVCYIVIGQNGEGLKPELQNDKRVTARVVWVRTASGAGIPTEVDGGTYCIVFAVDTVFRHPLITALSQHVAGGDSLVVADAHGMPALAMLPATQMPWVLADLAQGKPLQEITAFTQSSKLPASVVPGHFFCRVSSRLSAASVEHAFLRSLENPRDGFVDTYLNRKLSRPITRWLLRTPLTPNQITIFSCSVGLLGAACFFPGGYWGPLVGALLLQFSAVFDCCDGEVARVKFMESPFGDWLDIVCDTIVHLAIFLGIGVAVWRNETENYALVLAGVLALGVFLAFPLVTLAEKTEQGGVRRGGWEDRWIKKLLAALATRDFSVLIVVCAVVDKLDWFLWGAAIGAHIFWLFLAWLLLRAGRFVWLRNAWKRKET